jgi:hypothetical protein
VQIEGDLQLARFVAGLGGLRCRREIGDLVGVMMDALPHLQLPEDKLTTLMEAAQVCPDRCEIRRQIKRVMIMPCDRYMACGPMYIRIK